MNNPFDWQPADTAPKDGSHILVCHGPYMSLTWGFNQSPPCVVHYWPNAGEEGFYLSHGLVDGFNDKPVVFTHWCRLVGFEPLRGS